MISAINSNGNKVNFRGTTIINSCGKDLREVIMHTSRITSSIRITNGLHNDCEILTIFRHSDNMVEKDFLKILKQRGVEFFHTHKKIKLNDPIEKINALIDKVMKKKNWTKYNELDIGIQKEGA